MLQELYGCCESYLALQDALFSRQQHEGETLLEFSFALMSLMAFVKQCALTDVLNAEVLLGDQFTEHVLDGALHHELKQFVRRCEAIRWEHKGLPAGVRGRSNSVPAIFGIQYGLQSHSQVVADAHQESELKELREMIRLQQEQLNQLIQSITCLQSFHQCSCSLHQGTIICLCCQQPGHMARECDGVGVPPCT